MKKVLIAFGILTAVAGLFALVTTVSIEKMLDGAFAFEDDEDFFGGMDE